MHDLEIRPCRATECETVLEIWRAYHAPSVTDRIDEVRRLVENFADHLLVARLDGRIVGTVIAGWDGWRGHLHHLAVLPEFRRQGIARALVTEAERALAGKGAKRISVLAERDNRDAIAFYESLADLGYTLDTRMQRYTRTFPAATD